MRALTFLSLCCCFTDCVVNSKNLRPDFQIGVNIYAYSYKDELVCFHFSSFSDNASFHSLLSLACVGHLQSSNAQEDGTEDQHASQAVEDEAIRQGEAI